MNTTAPDGNGSDRTPSLALIGVTGYGAIYWQYLRELMVAGRARLVAAVVINPKEVPGPLAEMNARGTRIYASHEEMFAAEAGKVDLCLIPTGIHWHARMTLAALRAGMNVLVEKPLAGSMVDVHAIQQAERESGCWVAVGFQDIYQEEAAWLKTVVCAGTIGEIRRVRMVGAWPRPISYYKRNEWAGRLRADGAAALDSPLNNAFAHFVNLSFFLACREPDAAVDVRPTQASLWRAHAIESFDTGYVRAETSAGIVCEFFVTHTGAYRKEPEIYLEGTMGFATWNHDSSVGVYPSAGDPVVRKMHKAEWAARRLMFLAALRRIDDPSVFICTTQIAAKHTAFIDALHRLACVRSIAPERIDWEPVGHGGDFIPVVRGLFGRLEDGPEGERHFLSILADLSAPMARA